MLGQATLRECIELIGNKIGNYIYLYSIYIPLIIYLIFYTSSNPLNETKYVPKRLRKTWKYSLKKWTLDKSSNIMNKIFTHAENMKITYQTEGG